MRAGSTAVISELKARIKGAELAESTHSIPTLPTHPAVHRLLGSPLVAGGCYSVIGSATLAMQFLQAASASGTWCAVLGVRDFGYEYAASIGMRLDRMVSIPHLGVDWMSTAAALAGAACTLLITPPTPPTSAQAERILSKLRAHGSALVSTSKWPHALATVQIEATHWRTDTDFLAIAHRDVAVEMRGHTIRKSA